MTATESGRVQVVYTANVGSPLTVDVAADDVVITVDDTSDFDTDGTLQVAGETIDYSAVDDDTGQVTLDWAVTGTAEAGDIVTLWDTGLDLPAVEYRAHVALPGVLDNADAVDATIRHTLIAYLAEGIRTPGTGESVRMERHGSDWVIVDLLGKRADLPSNVVTGSQDDPTGTSITATVAGPGSSTTDGVNSIAIGNAAQAIGVNAVAIGPDAAASNVGIAVGMGAAAQSNESIAIGRGANTDSAGTSHDSVAIGSTATTTGTDASAYGRRSIAAGDGGTAIGADARAWSPQSTALGNVAAAGEQYDTSNHYTLAAGVGTVATKSGSVALGTDSAGTGASATTADDFALGTAAHKVKVAGRLNVAQRTPFNSADTQGTVGDITSDGDYLYVKTLAGWKRVALSTFAAAPGAATGTAAMTLAATATATGPVAATGTASMTLAAAATAAAGPVGTTGTASMSLGATAAAAAAATGSASMSLAAAAAVGPAAATGTAAMTLAATATVVSGYATAVLADSPAVYCRLDDASGNFADSSGNARNATVTGTPTYSQPPAGSLIDGNSITFGGGQYGDLGTTTFLNSLSQLTVEAWFKTTDTGANLNIVARDNTSGSTFRGWRLRMVTGQINCIVFGPTSSTVANFTSPLSYNDGNWHHAVLTAAGSGNAFLYIDGAQVATAAVISSMAAGNISGEHTYIAATHASLPWIGSLDEVAIYTTALSAARVLAHYNAGH